VEYSSSGHVHVPKNGFLIRILSSYFGKTCKWKGQSYVCIGKEFLDYRNDEEDIKQEIGEGVKRSLNS
jgi:hypothetical protein